MRKKRERLTRTKVTSVCELLLQPKCHLDRFIWIDCYRCNERLKSLLVQNEVYAPRDPECVGLEYLICRDKSCSDCQKRERRRKFSRRVRGREGCCLNQLVDLMVEERYLPLTGRAVNNKMSDINPFVSRFISTSTSFVPAANNSLLRMVNTVSRDPNHNNFNVTREDS